MQKVDSLSKLPDHLLLNILERVETLDALRACILSNRMLKLPPMMSLLDIDIGYSSPMSTPLIVFFTTTLLWLLSRTRYLVQGNPRSPSASCLRHDECLSISQVVARTMATQKKLDIAEFVVLTEKTSWRGTQHDLLSFAKRFNT